jgi:predicted 3-demethylubiquinone-9 3-methyltransferase (glyoxalase superfamily)
MKTPITPCLWFDSEGEDAANFYVSVIEDSRIVKVTPYTVDTPSDKPLGTVMTVDFELRGQPFTALNGGPEFTFNEAISLQLICDSQEESDRYWEALGAGGEFGPCGWLKDRFGVSWQIFPQELVELMEDPDADRAKRATEAMLKQSKIDLAQIRAAMDG